MLYNYTINRWIKLQKNTSDKKELKKTDWSIVKRLVMFLYYNNKTKRTALAMKCNMSYDKCVLYLDWLSKMRFINKQTSENGFELISLNDKGKELYELVKD